MRRRAERLRSFSSQNALQFRGTPGKEPGLQFLLSGVAIGAIYGLIGMALAITFYVTRIINFAQGQMMMATVMVTAEVRAAGYPTWAAALLGLGCACVLGVLSYLIAV